MTGKHAAPAPNRDRLKAGFSRWTTRLTELAFAVFMRDLVAYAWEVITQL